MIKYPHKVKFRLQRQISIIIVVDLDNYYIIIRVPVNPHISRNDVKNYSSVRISARRISARSGLAHTLTQLHVPIIYTIISTP